MPALTPDTLAKITNFHGLVDLLRNHLDWPISEDVEPEDITFDWDAAELGLKANEVSKIRQIKQLRPLKTEQPWGVFFISFEDKSLSVTVLRRLLRSLVLRKRSSTQTADRQAWDKHDLMFATNFGPSGQRELAFIHFSDEGKTNDLPVMKVLGWNAKDTVPHNQHAANMLQQRLRWPDDDKDEGKWRNQWSSAFELANNQVIQTSKELAIRLASLAQEMRSRANQLLIAETDKGPMRTMLAAFRTNLIQDLDEDGFADMFAQTITYGLLAAHISRPSGGLVADNLVDMVPKTNPFLRELFGTFLSLGGRDKGKNLDFDELGVRDVVDMLGKANMEAVLRDFGNRNPRKDPVIHFYEDFLREYDADQKIEAGIFYTPPAVVNFIVRGVDEMLRTEFELELGLADTTTWGELAARNDKIKLPAHVNPETPFVQILDPATGTGTFLVEVIDLIEKRMKGHWRHQKHSESDVKRLWNEYVPQHLLPRVTAFELKMAAYAIAHMKIGVKLVSTGYTFGSDERAHILLTNSLQPHIDLDYSLGFMKDAFAHEAERANAAKDNVPFTVVIGNPPYSKSMTKNTWINNLAAIFRDGLDEKKSDTQREEWKFFRFATHLREKVGYGVLGYISNNSFLTAPTLIKFRQHLSEKYSLAYLLNLHGDTNKREVSPSGSTDENVFDIRQGVSITLACYASDFEGDENFYYGDIWGDREQKLGRLETENCKSLVNRNPLLSWQKAPWQFYPSNGNEPLDGAKISDILPVVCGIETKRDHFALDLDYKTLVDRFDQFREFTGSTEELKRSFQVDDNDWVVSSAKEKLKLDLNWRAMIVPCSVRPFDRRYVMYCDYVLARTRGNAMASMQFENLALVVPRQTKEDFGCFVVDTTITHKFVTAYDRSFLLPLFEYLGSTKQTAHVRLATEFCSTLGLNIGLEYVSKRPHGDLQNTVGFKDIFDWIYAVLHAPSYRTRYAEFLKSDFPRIPTPGSRDLFATLVAKGRELVALHLLKPDEAPVLKAPDITFHGSGEARVAKGYPEYKNGMVMINANRWFEDVPSATWEFYVGGYQVCEKWLKDRAEKGGKNPKPGRVLTDDDILHYRRVVVSLTETRRIMAEIDKVIDAHGGWPGAFGGVNGKTQ
jgi:predicted helicase